MLFKLTQTICNEWLIKHGYTDYRVLKEMPEYGETNVLYLISDTDKKYPLCDLGWVSYIEILEQFFRDDTIRRERARNMASRIGSPVPPWAIDEESLNHG